MRYIEGLKFKVKTDKSERSAGKVVYSTDGTEKQILEESISYLKYGDHATMLPEKVTHRYAGQMGLRHSNTRRALSCGNRSFFL